MAAATALLMVACGGSRESTSSEPPPAPRPSPTEASEPERTPTEPTVANGPILFTQDLPHDGDDQTTIRALDPDGTDVRTILAGAWQPSWSPDGTRIAYSDYPGGVTQVFTMNADGTGIRQLTDLAHGAEHPAWSPDGTRIAYVAYDQDVLTSVWTVRAVDGADPHEVVPGVYDDGNPTMAWEPAWGPDGRIAFSAIAWTPDGKPEDAIFTVRADGTDMTRVTAGSGAFTPDWSPDGRWLAYERHQGSDPSTLHVVAADGTDDRQLVDLDGGVSEPAWAPDGTQILFVMAGDPASEEAAPTGGLWVVDIDGTNLRELYAEGSAPSWAPAPQD